MTTHQQKKLDDEALLAFRDRFALPLSDEDVRALRFYKPAATTAPEMTYLHARRAGARRLPAGAQPRRRRSSPAPRARRVREVSLEGTQGREQSTTMVFVQHAVAAAARTRRSASASCRSSPTRRAPSACRRCSARSAIYSLGRPALRARGPATSCSTTRKRRTARSSRRASPRRARIASWIAAATSYSAHGVPMLPFYIFYSMFGFQRVGDLIWAAADSRARGFLLGATAGPHHARRARACSTRTARATSLASTDPELRAYDPCFGYELAVILQDGMRRMLEAQEDVFYYVTVMNENYAHPAMPAGARGRHPARACTGCARGAGAGAQARAAARRGHDPARSARGRRTARARVRRRRRRLERHELHRAAARRHGMRARNRAHRGRRGASWVEQCLAARRARSSRRATTCARSPTDPRLGAAAATSTLGTDGFGRSDTRAALRAFFGGRSRRDRARGAAPRWASAPEEAAHRLLGHALQERGGFPVHLAVVVVGVADGRLAIQARVHHAGGEVGADQVRVAAVVGLLQHWMPGRWR